MGCRIIRNWGTVFLLAAFVCCAVSGCNEKEKAGVENTFYVELINFSKDSLRQQVEQDIFGKVSYYKNGKLEVLSLNYVTDEFPALHYFYNAALLTDKIPANTRKIRIEFTGDYSVDSIGYAMQKFIYKGNEWVKISDMGVLKGTTTYKKAKLFAISEFSKQIVRNAVEYSYN